MPVEASLSYKLPKGTRLCSHTAVDRLFIPGNKAQGSIAYPLRAVWNPASTRREGAPIQFLITIPKKKLHHAVDRVTMRRRVREAYRLNRARFECNVAEGDHVDVAFIYLADKLLPYSMVERALVKLLSRIAPFTDSENQEQP